MKYKLKKILSSNWLLCTLLTLAVLAGMLSGFYPMQFLEYKAYDFLTGLRHRNDASPVVIVKIDEKSIKEIGCWPWPRAYIADGIERLSSFSPRVMGIHLLFPGQEINPGLKTVQQVRKTLRTDAFLKKRKSRYKLDKILAKAEKNLDNDARLTDAVNRARNAVLPLRFSMDASAGKKGNVSTLPDWVARHSMALQKFDSQPVNQNNSAIVAADVTPTYEDLARRSSALGHTNMVADRDGAVRTLPMLIRYKGRYYPSFVLQLTAKYVGGGLSDIQPGDAGLALKSIDIPTDDEYRMLIDYGGKNQRFQSVSFSEIYNDTIAAETFRGKIVLLGSTIPWLTPSFRTTTRASLTEVEITASAVENILNNKHFSRPVWAYVLEILVVVYFGLFLVFVVPRVKPRDGALILSIFLITWLCFTVFLFMVFGYWLRIFAPVFLTVLGYSFAGFHRFADDKQKDSIELNKTLGLSFQAKGMLEMAFGKFKKCPVDNVSVRELLYNLGQDFERKRMFNKALAVYTHMLKAGRYRDIYQRIETLRSLGESASPVSTVKNDTMILDNGTTKPTLGRYEILKELGQGAMGTVYLGRDPKINREVAIKTLTYANVDDGLLDEIKERFVREAEAAGNLSHPNIVTIFDVGEEHDMAYMAMELLKGNDLAEHCRKDNLMPIKKVLDLIAAVADALDYAHSNGVVHRDIKPDNIVLLEEGKVKVADFGIARVMSSSETQTGVLLGTPSYMSPEQVEGARVDGRSDLFSLGVVLYEMLSGEKPFKGDNLANMLYAIANSAYTPLTRVNIDVPACCNKIIKKLLIKDPEKRVKSADKVAKDIRRCLDTL
jgi:serine/threonine-protein kinase